MSRKAIGTALPLHSLLRKVGPFARECTGAERHALSILGGNCAAADRNRSSEPIPEQPSTGPAGEIAIVNGFMLDSAGKPGIGGLGRDTGSRRES